MRRDPLPWGRPAELRGKGAELYSAVYCELEDVKQRHPSYCGTCTVPRLKRAAQPSKRQCTLVRNSELEDVKQRHNRRGRASRCRTQALASTLRGRCIGRRRAAPPVNRKHTGPKVCKVTTDSTAATSKIAASHVVGDWYSPQRQNDAQLDSHEHVGAQR